MCYDPDRDMSEDMHWWILDRIMFGHIDDEAEMQSMREGGTILHV